MTEKIRVTGLKELRKGLKEADATFPKQLQKANKRIAEELVPEARSRMAGHSPRAGSRAIGTIRALASGTRAQLAGGTAAVPWYGGHEWGSIRYRQFPAKNSDGYALYPAITANRERMVERYGEMLDELLRTAFPG